LIAEVKMKTATLGSWTIELKKGGNEKKIDRKVGSKNDGAIRLRSN
jgi:hypothetical protein